MKEVWVAGMATRDDVMEIPSPGNGDPAFPGDSIITAGTWHASTISIAAGKTITLDAQGDPDAVFLFQADTTMLVGAGCEIILLNGAKAENVLWAVGTALSVGEGVDFQGSVVAGTAITFGANTDIRGSILGGAAITFGANTVVDGSVMAGAAITFGTATEVNGSVVAVAAITFGTTSTVTGTNGIDCTDGRRLRGSAVKR
jgi:hypothetical protein